MNAIDNRAPESRLVREIWAGLGPDQQPAPSVAFTGTQRLLTSVYDVSGFAAACVGAASAAVSAHWGLVRSSSAPDVCIDRAHVAAAFQSERLYRLLDSERPALWDPVAGNYSTRDGFIRLHTNYEHHRIAALKVLGVAADRSAVSGAVSRWSSDDLERAIVAAGGCAAAMRSRAAWQAHEQGRAVAAEPLVDVTLGPPCMSVSAAPPQPEAPDRSPVAPPTPLSGLRVLDLTRVLSGPACTRFLASYGADVLRIDPPGFQDVPAALPDTTVGKRRTRLDLRATGDRARFEELLADADVLVVSYRRDALARLGYDMDDLWARRPTLIVARVVAYGHTGPWADRRGYDSLVQMSSGIAAQGRRQPEGNHSEVGARSAEGERPVPLPLQALDHGTGYLLAAAVIRSLSRLAHSGRASEVRLSLARTAELLCSTFDLDGALATGAALDPAPFLEEASSGFGRIRRVKPLAGIAGMEPAWARPAGPLGSHPPSWT